MGTLYNMGTLFDLYKKYMINHPNHPVNPDAYIDDDGSTLYYGRISCAGGIYCMTKEQIERMCHTIDDYRSRYKYTYENPKIIIDSLPSIEEERSKYIYQDCSSLTFPISSGCTWPINGAMKGSIDKFYELDNKIRRHREKLDERMKDHIWNWHHEFFEYCRKHFKYPDLVDYSEITKPYNIIRKGEFNL